MYTFSAFSLKTLNFPRVLGEKACQERLSCKNQNIYIYRYIYIYKEQNLCGECLNEQQT